MSDRGSIVLMVGLVVVALSAAAIGGAAAVFDQVGARGRAQIAADAAALAGVTGGRSASSDLAGANAGRLVGWRRLPDAVTIEVVVEVDGVRATARATDAP